jgi:hypothetical protein
LIQASPFAKRPKKELSVLPGGSAFTSSPAARRSPSFRSIFPDEGYRPGTFVRGAASVDPV